MRAVLFDGSTQEVAVAWAKRGLYVTKAVDASPGWTISHRGGTRIGPLCGIRSKRFAVALAEMLVQVLDWREVPDRAAKFKRRELVEITEFVRAVAEMAGL